MSYVERMKRISDYRELRRNRPRCIGARIVATPHIPRTREQQERVRQLTNELATYQMKAEHTLCEHIRIVNQKIEQIIRSGKRMNDMQKWFALQYTLPDEYSYCFSIIFAAIKEDVSYDEYVYACLEDNIWHNLKRMSKLTISPNIRISKGYTINFPWLKKMTTTIMDKEKIKESMPRAIRFR